MTFTPPVNYSTSRKNILIRWLLYMIGVSMVLFGFFSSFAQQKTRTLWILDNSLSMLAQDVKNVDNVYTSRLALAKHIIWSGSADIWGKHALIIASQGARLISPMTWDAGIFQDILAGVKIQRYGWWSDWYTPLKIATSIYGDAQDVNIFWITDGEFANPYKPHQDMIVPQNLTIIGVWTPVGSHIIERYAPSGEPVYKMHEWSRVVSKRSDDMLQTLSKQLQAKLILLDTFSLPSFFVPHISSIFALRWYMIIGVLLLIIASIYPRFRYF